MKQWRSFSIGLLAMTACSGSVSSTDSSGAAAGSDGVAGSGTSSSAGSSAPSTSGAGGAAPGIPMGSDSGAVSLGDRPAPGACGLATAAFCDPFDVASPGGRAGDLDDEHWSAARISTTINVSQGAYNAFAPTITKACGQETPGVLADKDMFFCAGGPTASMHFNDSYNDSGGFDIHSYRIRRPFDFADRTGIIAFDVGAKGQTPGGHGWWFNVFIASEPVPAPYQQGGAIALYAKAGIGIEFEGGGGRTDCSGVDGTCNAVSSFYAEKDYAIVDKQSVYAPASVLFKTQEEVLNHVEIHVGPTRVEVFVADAGNPSSLRSVAVVDQKTAPNFFPMPLTRGYVNLQHTHYNAAKSVVLPAYTTYHWDNVGFDGPFLPTPRSYEVPDTLTAYAANGGVNLGYLLGKTGMSGAKGAAAPVTLPNVDLTNAADAVVTLNAWGFCPGDNIGFRFNGGTWRKFKCPFPTSFGDNNNPEGTCDGGARAVAIPVDLADLKQGDNTMELSSDSGTVPMANAELSVNTH